MPKHGDIRNARIEREVFGEPLVSASTGRQITAGSSAHEVSVDERWCAACGRWIEVRGIMGGLRWGFEHAVLSDHHGGIDVG